MPKGVGLLAECPSFWPESGVGAIFRAVTQRGGVLSTYPALSAPVFEPSIPPSKYLTLSAPHEEEGTK